LLQHDVETRKGETASKPRPTGIIVFGIIVVVIVLGLLAFGFLPRIANNQELNSIKKEQDTAVPIFNAIKSQASAPVETLTLPASIIAIQEIPLYARTDGYLKERFVDIGDHVKKGQLLLIIETPELDKQLKQALFELKQAESSLESAKADYKQSLAQLANSEANVEKSKAALIFAKTQVVRYKELARQGAVSYEDKDTRVRDVDSQLADLNAYEAAVVAAQSSVNSYRSKIDVAQAAVRAARSNFERLEQLVGFEKVVAPADGVISARNVDAGALVTSGSNQGVTELLRMVKTDVLRVYVYVPQSYFQTIFSGMKAQIAVAEMPGKIFEGKVSNVSGGLDANSRTLQTEVRIPNKDNLLKPGMYAQVIFSVSRPKPPVLVPSNTLVVRADGLYVAVVEKDGRIRFHHVSAGRDYGRTIELVDGLAPNETVVTDPPDDLADGQKVSPSIKKFDAAQISVSGISPQKPPEPPKEQEKSTGKSKASSGQDPSSTAEANSASTPATSASGAAISPGAPVNLQPSPASTAPSGIPSGEPNHDPTARPGTTLFGKPANK
jgi:RND family efflux transporter MFP subunit